MGISFGVSAGSLADGSSIIAENGKLATVLSSNRGQFILNGSIPVTTTFYSIDCPASTQTLSNAGLAYASGSSGSVYFTPNYSGKILVFWNVVMNGSTTGTFPINYALFYGSGTPYTQGNSDFNLDVGTTIKYVTQPFGITITGDSPFQNNSSGGMIIVDTLTLGTQYYFEIGIGIFNGSTYSNAVTVDLINVIISWMEI